MTSFTSLHDRFVPALPTTWRALPLHLFVGYGFLFYGYARLSHGSENLAKMLAGLHMPFPELLAWLTTITEMAGGSLC
jgi:putative oxidoreductase